MAEQKANTAETSSNQNPVPVRRSRAGEAWCIADEGRIYFAGSFQAGVLRDVRFVARARRMTCVSGQDSDGEVVGVLASSGNKNPAPRRKFARKVKVFYSREVRFFHEEGDLEARLETCDELHLRKDGAAFAYWFS